MSAALICLLAVVLDGILGEPKRFHPLVGFGTIANRIEQRMNRPADARSARLAGTIAVVIALLPIVAVVWWLSRFDSIGWLVEMLALYLAIAPKALAQHAEQIFQALLSGPIEAAQKSLGQIVSRDTSQLNEEEIARASIESVLENGADAIFSAIFWFIIAGAPGVVFYRLANTLDAMWGYRNERFLQFGWAAARLDDLLNYIPARLTAFSYACTGRFSQAMHCWRQQAPLWYSPNAGPVMAAGAGALGIQLGGAATYDGERKHRPSLGIGNAAAAKDIPRAVRMVREALAIWIITLLLGSWLFA